MGIPCEGLHSHYCPLSALLPLLLLLTLVLPCTNGSGVGGVQPVHSTSSSGGGNATKQSFFPEGFRPMPEKDVPYPNIDKRDVVEQLYHTQYVKLDWKHMPLVFNLLYQTFAGLQMSHLATSGVLVSHHERQAQQEHLQRTRRRQQIPATTAPVSILPQLIAGDPNHGDSCVVQSFLDIYFVHPVPPGKFSQAFCTTFLELMHLPKMPPLVVDMYNWHLGEFTLWCLYYQSHALQSAKRKFVLVGSESDHPTTFAFFFYEREYVMFHQSSVNLTYLLHHPLLAHLYSVNGNVRHPKFTPLPIGFLFYHRNFRGLSPTRPDQMLQDEMIHSQHMKLYLKGLDLHKVFPHIQHELRFGRVGAVWLETALEMFAGGTTDPPVEWIPLEQLPERVTTIYVVLMPLEREKREGRPSLTSEVLVFRSESGNRATAAAQHVALLPFTAALYHKLQQHPYGDPKRDDRVVVAFANWTWREPMRDHFLMNHFLAVSPSSHFQSEFFAILNEFSFVASPVGIGYECYRTWESLMFGAIPILQNPVELTARMYSVGSTGALQYGREVDVSALMSVYDGLPVVFVNDPVDISYSHLIEWKKAIYEKMRRGEYNLEKLFMQHWIDRIYGHRNED